jgi:predicted negative regulator of RcsB-dependent stress response
MSESDILTELLSEAEHEKRLLLFKKTLPWIVAGALLIACLIAGYNWYQNRLEQQQKINGDLLFDTVLGDKIESPDLLEKSLALLAANKHIRQSELAGFYFAARLASERKTNEALSLLQTMVDEKSHHALTRSYARILWLSLVLDQDEITGQMKIVANEYMSYFTNPEQEFFFLATLMKALFYQKTQQFALAIEGANVILGAKNADNGLKLQAKALLDRLQYYNF